MVSCHVVLELVAVGSGRRLPSGDLLDRVEVIGKVLGIGMANFPVGRETGISLLTTTSSALIFMIDTCSMRGDLGVMHCHLIIFSRSITYHDFCENSRFNGLFG